jgi:putative membrane protein
MWNYPVGFMMGYGGFGWLAMIAWWALVIIGIVLLIRWASGQPRDRRWTHERTALDILNERYAKGEISKEEFEEKRKDIEAR